MSRTFASGQHLLRGSALLTAYPISFAAWVNVTSLAASCGVLGIANPAGGGSGGWHLYTDTAGAVWAEVIGSTNVAATTTAHVTTNAWFHVAGVWASATARIAYLSGANKVTGPTTSATAPTGMSNTIVGSIYQNAYFDMVGSIAFAGIWNVALSDADIASLGAGASPRRVRPDALKSYIPLVSSASPEPDLIGGSYALTGTPTLNAANPRIYDP
jgi:hypothetical protein